jgi:hypothetical protein
MHNQFPNGATTEVIKLTPEKAKSLLSKMAGSDDSILLDQIVAALEQTNWKHAKHLIESTNLNRRIRWTHLCKLSEQIKTGKWELTHQGIALREDGTLIDGQHRCLAVVMAGVSIKILITHGVSDDAYKVIDTGSARTAADGFNNLKNAYAVSAAARLIIAFKQGYRLGYHKSGTTNREVIDFVSANPRIEECVSLSKEVMKGGPATKSFIGALRFLLTEIEDDEGNAFADAFQTDGVASPLDPICALRSKVLNKSVDKYTVGAAALRAWELHKRGQKMRHFIIRDTDGYKVYSCKNGSKGVPTPLV